MKKKILNIIKLAVTTTLLFILIQDVNLQEVAKQITKINCFILIPLLVYPIGIIISSLKWKIALNQKIKLIKLAKIYWISNFFSNFLPSTIGGDSYKIIKLRKYGKINILKSIIIERGIGFFTLLILTGLFSISQYPKIIIRIIIENLVLILIPLIVLLITLLLINKKRLNKYLVTLKLENKKIIKLLLLSTTYILLGGLTLFTYFIMFNYKINPIYVITSYLIVQSLTMIPISINGWGVREISYVYLFNIASVPGEITLGIVLISRLMSIIATGIGGIIFIIDKKQKK